MRTQYVRYPLHPRLLALVLGVVALALSACGLTERFSTSPASFDRNNAQRQAWEALGITSYRSIIEVERYNERRRVEVLVQNGDVVRVTLRYWNDETGDWDPPQELTGQRAEPYTVPGLFGMVGGELAGQQRTVAVRYDDQYAFPVLIRLGNVHEQDGTVLPDTEVTVRVLEFEPIR